MMMTQIVLEIPTGSSAAFYDGDGDDTRALVLPERGPRIGSSVSVVWRGVSMRVVPGDDVPGGAPAGPQGSGSTERPG